jgi:hypothetical protein
MSQMNHGAMKMDSATAGTTTSSTRTLPALPPNLPSWLDSNKNNEIFYKRGPYNFAIYDIPTLARDMNGVAVGHAMAYEALVTGRADQLETTVFNNIDRVLKNPPKLMPAERFLSPTFGQKYGVLELVFDWTHVSHAQTIDNFVSTWTDNAGKDKETQVLWDYYKNEGAPFVITGLPMNMAWLDSQPYSGAFRRKYPKVNALFWGYHWLQTSIYDAMRDKSLSEQKKVYEQLGQRYHEVELYDTKRPFMPMMAETSPMFSARFPEIANAFDNLHMLHDMVNDILASDWMTDAQKQEQIKRAIYIMSPDAHKDCKPGENRGVINGVSHDHRFMDGMPGMGMMKNGLESTINPVADPAPFKTDDKANNNATAEQNDGMSGMEHSAMKMSGATSSTQVVTRVSAQVADNGKNDDSTQSEASAFDPTELMWMPKMGWMNMSQCHHCSMPLPGNGEDPTKAWQASTVSAEGWTMRVRCALCARDMSAEVKGGSILSLSTEDPNVRITVFSDEQGNLTTQAKGVVFLEEKAGHPRCSQWSQAFTSKAAFEAYVAKNPKFKDAKPLTFEEWANVEAAGTPETYVKEEGPVKNPYAEDMKARGIDVEDDTTREDTTSDDSTNNAEAGQ